MRSDAGLTCGHTGEAISARKLATVVSSGKKRSDKEGFEQIGYSEDIQCIN